jgi:hypothetical protein
LPPTAFDNSTTRPALYLRLNTEKRDAADTKTKGFEEQNDYRMTQFVDNDSWRIQPEPEHQAAITTQQPVAYLIDAPPQSLARDTQQNKQDKDASDDEPWLI